MRIKGKGVLRTEQITCRVLVFISAIAFALCIVMEYCFPLFINDFYCELLHLDFLKNVMLGISGSSIISFICIIFPYLKKRKDFTMTISSHIESIFLCYLDIYNDLVSVSTRDIVIKKDDVDTYGFELKLYKAAQELLEKLNLFVVDYMNSDWLSQDVDNLIRFLKRNIEINLNAIKCAMSCMVPEEYNNNPLDISEDLKKDFVIKRSEKDVSILILKEMNEILKLEEFKQYFKPFNLREDTVRFKEEFISRCSQLINDFEESQSMLDKTVYDGLIKRLNGEINLIKAKHKHQYFKEKYELKVAFLRTFEKIDDWDETISRKFEKALQEDRMDDARKIIDELKSSD